MDLNTLGEILRRQAATSALTFDQTFLSADQVKALSKGFALDAGAFLVVSGVTPADIPAPVNGVLSVNAGTVSVLGRSGLVAAMRFTIDDSGTVQFAVQADFADTWTVPDSFPAPPRFPSGAEKPTAAAALYASVGVVGWTPWPSRPDETVDLAAGINLVCRFGTEGSGASVSCGPLRLDRPSARSNGGPNLDSVLTGDWTAHTEAEYVHFLRIAEAFGFPEDAMPDIPADLDLRMTASEFICGTTNEFHAVGLWSFAYGPAIFLARKDRDTGAWRHFFGMDIGKTIPISTLPLIADILSDEETVAIRDIEAVITSAAFPGELADEINSLIRGHATAFPGIPNPDGLGTGKGFGFSMAFAVGRDRIPIGFGAGQPDSAAAARVSVSNPHRVPAVRCSGRTRAGVGIPEETVWFDVQKTFGPVSIQKVGVAYKGNRICILANMTLSGLGLTIGLRGFGIDTPISSFDPHFDISGLSFTFARGGIVISGGLVGSIDPLDFVGSLIVQFPPYGIAGLAGYTSVGNSPSLFLYGVLTAPLGGPPFFFVTGAAAGFGFNRDLVVPDVSGISDFPLVAWAQGMDNPPSMDMTGDIGKQVEEVLDKLTDGGVVAPRVGQYWIAAGIKFTTFKLADTFALIVLKAGAEVELDLMGVSTIDIPPKAPVIHAEFQLLASFRPTEGFIGIAGQLTPDSYVLSPDCHLMGGYAYHMWFLGRHAGNFVITFGGYNPHFTPPDHFPKVPRLGINWQVIPPLVIKGEEYFAITSAAIMAGGGLSAVWKSGGISAWFSVEANFLIVYQPFHYHIDASIDLGAAIEINLFFTTLTISIHLGVGLEIWGPEFSGRATVHLAFISFTIEFNAAAKQTSTTIEWSEFARTLLPGIGGAGSRVAGLEQAGVSGTGGVRIDVTQGLVKSLSDQPNELNFILSPEVVEITVQTSIPIKEGKAGFRGVVELADPALQPKNAAGQTIVPNEDFGVGPVNLVDTEFAPTFDLEVRVLSSAVGKGADSVSLQCVRVLSSVPNALWKRPHFDIHGVPVFDDPLNDTTVPNVVTGYRIIPIVREPDRTMPVKIVHLHYTEPPTAQPINWSRAFAPANGPDNGGTVETTIMTAAAKANRAALMKVLNAVFDDIAPDADVASMVDPNKAGLLSQPVFSILGGAKAAA